VARAETSRWEGPDRARSAPLGRRKIQQRAEGDSLFPHGQPFRQRVGLIQPLPVADVPGLGGLVNWAGLGTPILRSGYDHPPFPEAALTIATMPARIASGNPGQAATRAARSGSVLHVSFGKCSATCDGP
jgi:hypothetical protein